jgi:hypothetical protein
MAKTFALATGLLFMAACSGSAPTGPTREVAPPRPSFLNNTTGCTTALTKTAGTPGQAHVAVACTKGQGQ